ncbi:hypothetical protein GQ55_3G350000 [Panicum hallii var. hallii]|uniref:Uncharacterized protein n=1 Tax=Panicum hallii var. hallii TaxID=1504633 RepID=A0A2T7EFT5_9POAL|nr:uncharacterized protein LOC112884045 isoform X1 [Panicum hallii]PUZ66686.1 hypothetical protein GQ55_3G350000 [Panicum hallii var. hallii]
MEKVFKLFFVPVWRWPKKDSVCLYRECSLLAPGSLGAEPSPSLLPREELWLWELRRPADALCCCHIELRGICGALCKFTWEYQRAQAPVMFLGIHLGVPD